MRTGDFSGNVTGRERWFLEGARARRRETDDKDRKTGHERWRGREECKMWEKKAD